MIISDAASLPKDVWVSISSYTPRDLKTLRLVSKFFKSIADIHIELLKKRIPSKKRSFEGQEMILASHLNRHHYVVVTKSFVRVFERERYSLYEVEKPFNVSRSSRIFTQNDQEIIYFPRSRLPGLRIDMNRKKADLFVPIPRLSRNIVYSQPDSEGAISAYADLTIYQFDKNGVIISEYPVSHLSLCRFLHMDRHFILALFEEGLLQRFPLDRAPFRIPPFIKASVLGDFLFLQLKIAPFGVNVYNIRFLNLIENCPLDSVQIAYWKEGIYLEASDQGTLNFFSFNPYRLIETLRLPTCGAKIGSFDLWGNLIALAFQKRVEVWDLHSRWLLKCFPFESEVLQVKFDNNELMINTQGGEIIILSSKLTD